MSNDMLKSMTRKYCVNGANFSLPDTCPSWFTAQLDELIKSHNREARFLQMPSFAGADAIGVFSDYAGTHKQARVQTYSFLFVDFGALGTFDEKVKEIRRRANLPLTREIAFKELRSGSVVSALPHLLRAADQLPGRMYRSAYPDIVPALLDLADAERASTESALALAEDLLSANGVAVGVDVAKVAADYLTSNTTGPGLLSGGNSSLPLLAAGAIGVGLLTSRSSNK